ncbi:hypothetical protein BCV02_16550 [Vibrio breoganii]|uniref:aldose epimerase family protein n=1 Tax=Vibrio breoganii TaxID=553239 RepID=UPI000C855F81|nr:aldose epimerase family protein [Vibrio breoganii]PMF98852.1 hypothetical protein BCV02_16550 [Vibrio breoganii]PMG92160.1 hypothetical protein BCU80_11470 [Vibrio breoganii]PMK16187.1 hypothetical protein BCU06_12685 [Vibrio breoganii]PMK29390.1 hypothetical protein BCU03_11180 [Vibrio breoganii]PML19930.1 hypothetical protein BCT84_00530 [Vibrio breoganii]
MKVRKETCGSFYNQRIIKTVLTNTNGMSVCLLNLGGIITEMWVPNEDGELKDVVLGPKTIQGYINDPHYFGACIGRVANRIENAQFTLDDETIKVNGNAYSGKHCVHGGRFGYHRRVWEITRTGETQEGVFVVLSLFDQDGEEGFKHSVWIEATYTLDNNNRLTLRFDAKSDRKSPISLTAHSYFNLFGHDYGSIGDHELKIYAQKLLQQKEDRIPNGELVPVEGSEFDFTQMTSLKRTTTSQVDINHSYQIESPKLQKVAELKGGGLRLELYSNESTLHFYNGHNLNGIQGKGSIAYDKFAGLCLEPKGYVNSVNIPHFPTTYVDKDNPYTHEIIYQFS